MNWELIIPIVIASVVIITFFVLVQPGLWFRAWISGCYVSLIRLLSMRFKRLDSKLLVNCYIKARKSGVDITIRRIERHAQARGNVNTVIEALIAAKNGKLDLTIETAMAIDLAGRDIKESVKYCITPKVIETDRITAIAKDGIELSVKAKITVRSNLKRIISSALEETIIARVCEGIITTIGGATNHKDLIENPDRISKSVLVNRSIYLDTAFDILSVDVADIVIGRNIGAELAIDAAEAEKYIAQASAEQRRTVAVAAEQEMKVLTQEMRARVLAAESELPRAIAEAFARGHIGVNDYYKIQNVLGDTEMRKSIAGTNQLLDAPRNTPKKKTKLG